MWKRSWIGASVPLLACILAWGPLGCTTDGDDDDTAADDDASDDDDDTGDDGVQIQYCEGTASHGTWPGLNDSMMDFFVGSF